MSGGGWERMLLTVSMSVTMSSALFFASSVFELIKALTAAPLANPCQQPDQILAKQIHSAKLQLHRVITQCLAAPDAQRITTPLEPFRSHLCGVLDLETLANLVC